MKRLFTVFVVLVVCIIFISVNSTMAGTLENIHATGKSSNKRPVIYFGRLSGEVPGMNNVILKPKAVIGIRDEIKIKKLTNNIDIFALYGNAKTGTGIKKSVMLQLRGKFTSLYPLYEDGKYESFNVGLYATFALPFNSYNPYIEFPATAYSLEEKEKISKELLLGADINFRFVYDKIDSSLHTIFFFHGKKIAPNLLAYQPLYGLDWSNNFFLLGNVTKPKLELSTELQFWFARKAGVSFFNMHDGLGGTKREFDYSLKLRYFFRKDVDAYVTAYGYNNLNRGKSNNSPYGFRDGYGFGVEYQF